MGVRMPKYGMSIPVKDLVAIKNKEPENKTIPKTKNNPDPFNDLETGSCLPNKMIARMTTV